MAKYKLVKTNTPPVWMRPLIPVLALLGTFILTSGLIIWSNANPFETYYQFLLGPLSSRVSILEVLVKATPLILTGAAVTFAFSTGYFQYRCRRAALRRSDCRCVVWASLSAACRPSWQSRS